MPKLHIACATDNGQDFSPNHFGAAKAYRIFACDTDAGSLEELAGFSNIPFAEEAHGSDAKAQHMGQQLKAHKIQAIVAWAIGANIKKMRLKFVPVLSRVRNIDQALQNLNLQALAQEAAKAPGESREIITISSESSAS